MLTDSFTQSKENRMNTLNIEKTNPNLEISSQQQKFYFGTENLRKINKKLYKTNRISTTKYNVLTFIPKSLLIQFRRAANIYFLIISILTFMPFSPKSPITMTGTFAIVLVFTMIKEAWEDIKRYKQDKDVNEKKTKVFLNKKFREVKWEEIITGDIILIENENAIPADIILLHSSNVGGIAFVETMNLDGESNLKEKFIPNFEKIRANSITEAEIQLSSLNGYVVCDKPNDNLEKWDCYFKIGHNIDSNINNNNSHDNKNSHLGSSRNNLNGDKAHEFRKQNTIEASNTSHCGIKQMILRACKLKNTDYVIGLVAYTGPNTKIMKNAKNPPIKSSNVMRVMNKLLYSVFIFQFLLCAMYSLAYVLWERSQGKHLPYIKKYNKTEELISPGWTAADYFIKFLTFLVAYSHLIPISLYVAMEIVKLIQSFFISKDLQMYDPEINKFASARTSDLIEELGQVQFVFSDKTGTLTKNEMQFRKCSINNKIYGERTEILPTENNSHLENSVNGETKPYEILMSKSEKNVDKIKIRDFFMALATCHSAYAQHKANKVIFQSSSPDEVALLEGASQMGFKFTNKTSSSIEIIDYTNKRIVYNILTELPFDSTRKRMSVIIRNKNHILLFTKGADSALIDRVKVNNQEKEKIQEHLDKFAREGLRTLVVCKKELTKEQYQSYQERLDFIKNSAEKSEVEDEKLAEIYEEIESDLNYLGATAIEDKLQDKVAETIESLINANIRLWVLTGDKKETAIEIGKSCKLIANDMDIIDLACNKDENMYQFTEKLDSFYMRENEGDKRVFLIIDGKSLSYVLSNKELSYKFFAVGVNANSVICCRVSPKQKSQVVKLAKTYGNWITLSIGDGANDVPMIMEAHIGIGISGKEGTQAVRSSDYAISQFYFLRKLLFVHGRWGYRRISFFICYYFYKNIVLVFTEIYFAIYSGFSGQIFFPDMLPVLYNAFWTSWPCIFSWSLERDVSAEISMNNPMLYKAGQKGYYFNLKRFWMWILMSIIHGAITFFSTVYGLDSFLNSNGLMNDHWFKSTVAFTVIIHIVNYKIFLHAKFWNNFTM